MSCLQLEDFSISFLSPLCQVDNFFPIFQPFQIKKLKLQLGAIRSLVAPHHRPPQSFGVVSVGNTIEN